MENKKLTAVEWLFEKMTEQGTNPYWDMRFIQAKQMEKEQIMNAYNDGADHMVESKYEGMDNYYKLRYGSDNKI